MKDNLLGSREKYYKYKFKYLKEKKNQFGGTSPSEDIQSFFTELYNIFKTEGTKYQSMMNMILKKRELHTSSSEQLFYDIKYKVYFILNLGFVFLDQKKDDKTMAINLILFIQLMSNNSFSEKKLQQIWSLVADKNDNNLIKLIEHQLILLKQKIIEKENILKPFLIVFRKDKKKHQLKLIEYVEVFNRLLYDLSKLTSLYNEIETQHKLYEKGHYLTSVDPKYMTNISEIYKKLCELNKWISGISDIFLYENWSDNIVKIFHEIISFAELINDLHDHELKLKINQLIEECKEILKKFSPIFDIK